MTAPTLPAFVTPPELAGSLGVSVPEAGPVLDSWTDALADASGHLRDVIGQPITAGEVTLEQRADHRGVIEIFLCPVTAITSVTDDAGNDVPATAREFREQKLYLPIPYALYTVTLNYGWTIIPSEIVRWTKVLAAAQIQAVTKRQTLGLAGDGVTSVAVDDGRVTFAADGSMSIEIPPKVETRLRAHYGGLQ